MAAVLAASIVAWALYDLSVERGSFAMPVSAGVSGGEEASAALLRLFGALVLALFVASGVGRRLHWVAAGFAVLGLGHLAFGYLEPLVKGGPPPLHEGLYESLLVHVLAGGLFVVGLVPRDPPLFSRRMVLVVAAGILGLALGLEALEERGMAPPMARGVDPVEASERGVSPLEWLTPWHWTLGALPLALAVAAAAGAVLQAGRENLRGWILIAAVLYAGSQLHDYLWPTGYGGMILSQADALRFAFALVVAVGGVLELRRVAAERAALLAAERDINRQLSELATLRADFTAMVAHELGGPLAAIRRLTEMLGTGEDDPSARRYAVAAIETETDALDALVEDVRSSAAIEREDFMVEPRPVPVGALLRDAETFARALPAEHPVSLSFGEDLEPRERVVADPERVGQVLRNLLCNAVKHSPEGAPVELRATRLGDGTGRVRIEVVDHGSGIHPDDVVRIFEKFGRGRDAGGKKVPGVGLGLYLSRRILRAHGSDLAVDSKPGEGSVFGFELKLAR
ncbi:hypothetical protein GBA65_19860 [Rubrobacter marinus]|uniref:histidine kinase n=1 Tax=Rubrobacter marinus TaxID=2653852 RepID=A0A6G8Q253_9ACTN|nr:HAMP domain-containing sensor histidine kinase [Rubrobacter marinus]QIN80397.1 hypothetical protein GBA65_19860 [Rubrobacter marinus]